MYLQIKELKDDVLNVGILDILENLPSTCYNYKWFLTTFIDVTLLDINDLYPLELEKEFSKSDKAIPFSWNELIKLFRNVNQVQECVVVAMNNELPPPKNCDWRWVCEESELGIESFDYSEVNLFSKNNDIYTLFREMYSNISECQ